MTLAEVVNVRHHIADSPTLVRFCTAVAVSRAVCSSQFANLRLRVRSERVKQCVNTGHNA
jgi:hypothetical protein